MSLTTISALLLTAASTNERLRWSIEPIPFVDLPQASHVVAEAMSPDGAITGRSGSTLGSVGWHAYVWVRGEGTVQCEDAGWSLSQGHAINSSHTIAGTVSTCPPQNGACAASPAVLRVDGEPDLIGPSVDQYPTIAGITEAGHVVFEQKFEDSWMTGGFVSMPTGVQVSLPLPDTAWSVDLVDPIVVDGITQSLFITGFAWMSPDRQPMVWIVDVTGGATAQWLPTPGQGGEATAMLDDGTVLGMVYLEGTVVPVEWPFPWTTWTQLADIDPDLWWDASTAGTDSGLRAGSVFMGSERAAWIRDAAGVITVLDAEALGLPPSDVTPIGFLADGSLLLDTLDLTFYTSTPGTWRADTGFARVSDRSFNADDLEGQGTGNVIAGADDGSLAINRYPEAWAAVALSSGDVDGDGSVTVDDLLALIALWGPCGAPCLEDLDANGTIGVDDLLLVLAALGG